VFCKMRVDFVKMGALAFLESHFQVELANSDVGRCQGLFSIRK
jgi:hypothetical protein